jgi:hypothetical protein
MGKFDFAIRYNQDWYPGGSWMFPVPDSGHWHFAVIPTFSFRHSSTLERIAPDVYEAERLRKFDEWLNSPH